jgi:uncharacterized protein YndB with AHSA1/START domain
MIEGERVLHEAWYPHPVDAVWSALTDPVELASWLMPNDFAAVVGGRFRLDARPEFGFIEGEVLRIEPPHLLQCRWVIEGTPTTLTIRLEADGAGTRLRLEHHGVPGQPQTAFDGGWAHKLAHDLDLVLSRGGQG